MTKTQFEAEIERLNYALANEPPIGSVIKFSKTFGANPTRVYDYVAHRDSRGWCVTKANGRTQFTWTDLLDFMVNQETKLPKIHIMHEASEWV